jgi:hypothetical protein
LGLPGLFTATPDGFVRVTVPLEPLQPSPLYAVTVTPYIPDVEGAVIENVTASAPPNSLPLFAYKYNVPAEGACVPLPTFQVFPDGGVRLMPEGIPQLVGVPKAIVTEPMLVLPVLVMVTVYDVVCDVTVYHVVCDVPNDGVIRATLKLTASVNVVVAVLVPSDAVTVYVPVIPSN